MPVHTGAGRKLAPLSRVLLILGGELSILFNAIAVWLFSAANHMPRPAAAFAAADRIAGLALQALLLAVLVAFANDLAARLLARREK